MHAHILDTNLKRKQSATLQKLAASPAPRLISSRRQCSGTSCRNTVSLAASPAPAFSFLAVTAPSPPAAGLSACRHRLHPPTRAQSPQHARCRRLRPPCAHPSALRIPRPRCQGPRTPLARPLVGRAATRGGHRRCLGDRRDTRQPLQAIMAVMT